MGSPAFFRYQYYYSHTFIKLLLKNMIVKMDKIY